MKGEVKNLERSDGRLLDCINPAFGIIAVRKVARYGLCEGLSIPGVWGILRHRAQTGSGPLPALNIMGIGVYSPDNPIGRNVMLTSHLHLMQRQKICASLSARPHTFLWRGA
jgi:hypothetical protein